MGTLRIILAISVVINHSNSIFGYSFIDGLVAVEVFFIISGFYMNMILKNKYTGKGSYKLFLSNRFLRLFPVYWFVLVLVVTLSVISGILFNDWYNLSSYLKWYNVLSIEALVYHACANLFLYGQDLVMFLGINPDDGKLFFTENFRSTFPEFHTFLFVPQAWSLGIELIFYAIAPLVVRSKLPVIVSLLILSLSLRGSIYFILGWKYDPWTYRFFPTELSLFLLGVISYNIYESIKDKPNIRYYAQIITIAFFLSTMMYQFVPGGHIKNWIYYLLACCCIPYIFYTTKKLPFDSRIGELSYPIYIVHLLIIWIISPLILRFDIEKYEGILAIIFSILVSIGLVRLISNPIDNIRQSRVIARNKKMLNKSSDPAFESEETQFHYA